ncbi:MAG TPA: DNA integrity scanning diadenylate cyclase DisA [Acidimicrobiales bacterium]|nr:DNA integrity scanning diadenylate cyclase DisA [Acidimicrobiales bacterium]
MPASDLRATLSSVAPGTALREGLERIMRGRTGALIVIGQDRVVDSISTGGFALDVPFTATGVRELAKMDGAIILDSSATRIMRAAVHLMPDPSIPTTESGTRHRTAERVARSLNVPVVAVSHRMNTITVYVGDHKHEIEPVPRLVNRANQAISTLERYRTRLDTDAAALSTLEIEDLVTIRDVINVVQVLEGVERIAEELERYIVELGDEGRLVRLQLVELVGGVQHDRRHIVRDYRGDDKTVPLDQVLDDLSSLTTEDLIDPSEVAHAMRLPTTAVDASIAPRGYRMLAKIPRLPDQVIQNIITRFGNLQKIMRATIDDLDDVEGVGAMRAKSIKEGLSRLAESAILDRY